MKKLVILVVAVVVVIGVLYVGAKGVRHMMRSSSAPAMQPTAMVSPSAMMSPSATGAANTLMMTKTSTTVGQYMTDPKGMTLYTFDKDTTGVSNCSGQCAVVWPPYMATNAPATLPENVTVIKRADGSMQYAWKGMPLYYYQKDKNPGDTLGDGVGGTWHVAK